MHPKIVRNGHYRAQMARLRGFTALLVLALLSATLVALSPAHEASAQGDASVRLNEVVTVNNSSLVAQDGSTPDWIELFNTGPAEVDLTNWGLSDDEARPHKWIFPAGTSIGAGDYLIVFASGLATVDAGELHTNFTLAASGEFLGLAAPDRSSVSQFDPVPALTADLAWGVTTAGGQGLFATPSPAALNSTSADGLLSDVAASPGRGFFDAPISVELTNTDPNATIRYTTDGSTPTANRGAIYAGPIPITSTTVVRAVAIRAGYLSPKPVTHTYVFSASAASQSRMNQAVVAANAADVEAGLNSLPVISLVATTESEDPRWTFVGDGFPIAVEMIFPDGTPGFQVDAGTREVGGTSVAYPKDTLRLLFDSDWGESELDYPVFAGHDLAGVPAVDSFKRLTLRTGSHDSGIRDDFTARAFIRARWHDEVMLELGHVNTHGRWVNVYLNGEYWGLYHLREHPNDDFMASYFGGDKSEYVGINRAAIASGQGTSWAALVAAATSWSTFEPFVDPVAYVDWMLLNEYGGNTWDLRATQNWRAAGPADDIGGEAKYIFHSSDPDIALVSATSQTSFPGPVSSWSALLAERDPEFMSLVADRIQALYFDGGVLTEAATQARTDRLIASIEQAIYPEWARWNWMPISQFTASVNWFRDVLHPQRTANMIGNFRQRNLLPAIVAPRIGTDALEQIVPQGSTVTLLNPNPSGMLLYTLDGSDPRLDGGSVSPAAFAGSSVAVVADMVVSARVRDGVTWSPLRSVRLVAQADPDAPQVSPVADMIDAHGFGVEFWIDADDAQDRALTFSSQGLPVGLSIDDVGRITGTPTQAGVFDVIISVENGVSVGSTGFRWTINEPGPDTRIPLVLNEYNAVVGDEMLGSSGVDTTFGRVIGNGGDWLELLVTETVDLRGWTVELSDRKGDDEVLAVTDTVTFSSSSTLAKLEAGTIITISEDGVEDLAVDPANGDWLLSAVSRTGFTSQLLTSDATNFDTNRHGFRVRVLDEAGRPRSPFMGETDSWRSRSQNVGSDEVFALCSVPEPGVDPGFVSDDQEELSTFGNANVCDGVPQMLSSLRVRLPGDVNCSQELDAADAQHILEHATGLRLGGEQCPLAADEGLNVVAADIDGDGAVGVRDALLVAQCALGVSNEVCP